jgi:isopenicillin-N N-acyltransferase like protein
MLIVLYIFLILVVGLTLLALYVVLVSRIKPPHPKDRSSEQWQRTETDKGLFTIGPNWLRKNAHGLYELYVEGPAYTRGVANGKLTKELLATQEGYFRDQIVHMIPSQSWLKFLKYMVGFFNRNLDHHVTKEYKEEIYGISLSASEEFNYIGHNYERLLNYHAAHDIGHAVQNLALVGCTSFGAWGSRSEGSELIIGRNFDFYAGDKFAENKIIQFTRPDKGFPFVSVTWGGFIGIVSGMNAGGLTVTINAAKSAIPTGSATPVSLVAREILQYAGNIDEALAIAKSRKMFVSESFLIGSAVDGKAIIIEKTPSTLDIHDPGAESILCSNHFQSPSLGQTESNQYQIQETASGDRFRRLEQLLEQAGPLTVEGALAVLRDPYGLDGKHLGYGHEKAMHQFIGHHSIIFLPRLQKMYVSTRHWQTGAFVEYDLNQIWGMNTPPSAEVATGLLSEDAFASNQDFMDFLSFRALQRRLEQGESIDLEAWVALNPDYYHGYVLSGDCLYKQKQYEGALGFYQQALAREVSNQSERLHIEKRIARCGKKTKP